MYKLIIVFLTYLITSTVLSQTSNSNPNNVTRQGFGTQEGFNIGLGFVNPDFVTDGSAYFFEDWNNEGIVYTKSEGNFKIEKVNINLMNSTLDALYDESSVFTFDTKNIMRIVINKKVFRVFEINNDYKIFEMFYNNGLSVYKFNSVLFSEGAVNPMLARKTNKYINEQEYFLYQDKILTKIKLGKKPFAKLFATSVSSQETIMNYIKDYQLSLKDEDDLKRIFTFLSKKN